MTAPKEHPYRKRFAISILLVVALVAVTIVLNGVASAAASIAGEQSTNAVPTSVATGPAGLHPSPGDQGPAARVAARPQVVVVQSTQLTLQPGQSTYDVVPTDFKAVRPTGYTVLATGFNASIGRADFVQSFGTFVGGLIANDSGVESSPVSLQATCGVAPGGVSAAAAQTTATDYQTTLEQVAALRR